MRPVGISSNKRRTIRRSGLSLLEVILAIVILGGALAVIGQLVRIGSRSAANARLQSEAQIICDAKMAEVAAGVLPLESTSGASVEENPSWIYSVEVTAAEQIGLLSVRLIVESSPSITADPRVFSLVRLMPDPDYEPEEALGSVTD